MSEMQSCDNFGHKPGSNHLQANKSFWKIIPSLGLKRSNTVNT